MSNHSPIPSPPPALVGEWQRTAPNLINKREHYHYITLCAAQWGADQELEACCEWIPEFCPWDAAQLRAARRELEACCEWIPEYCPWDAAQLRAARRPKPPSLKEQALSVLDDCANCLDSAHENTIRRALEALDD